MEAELLWPRVWQMACRLEEIPEPRRLRRVRDPRPVGRRGAHRRHGGEGLPERLPPPRRQGRRGPRDGARAGSSAPSTGGATAPTARTPSSPRAKTFSEHNLQPGDLDLTPVRCEVWGGCAWINLDDDAPPLRECIEPFATILDAWKVESLRTEWWYACRLPVNWKLAEEAFMEQYHVIETHPQLVIPGRYPPRDGGRSTRGPLDRRGAPLPAHDERGHGRDGARQRRARGRGPPRHGAARQTRRWRMSTWHRTLNDAVVRLAPGPRIGHPRPQRARGAGAQRADGLLLPALLRPAHVQQRLLVPLPPARARRRP